MTMEAKEDAYQIAQENKLDSNAMEALQFLPLFVFLYVEMD